MGATGGHPRRPADGVFHDADDLRSRGGPLLDPPRSCACELAAVVAEEIARWRTLAAAE